MQWYVSPSMYYYIHVSCKLTRVRLRCVRVMAAAILDAVPDDRELLLVAKENITSGFGTPLLECFLIPGRRVFVNSQKYS